ncbi:MAG: DUF1996 domain-containing protein, partial [Actinomycetota bacterium]|nr:DUF1996 domain-containing protein [Actinomycetota bacterium]
LCAVVAVAAACTSDVGWTAPEGAVAVPVDAAPARHLGPQGRTGQFVTDCAHSHSSPDDPIVHAGYPGRSHLHDFFGNTTTDADSTLETLLEGDTTCQMQHDTASYWAPALLDGGVVVEPKTSTAYYRAAPGVDPTQVRAYPAGLKIVAGDMTATTPQSTDLAGWSCGASTTHLASPPNCPPTSPLRGVITFPDCWNGRDLDSEDHRSHMANSVGGACPRSHPVHVPQLTFAITYPITGTGHDLTLSSGSTHGLHSDFFNAWDQDRLVREVESCLHRGAVCGLASNRAEDPLFSG